MEEKNQVSFKGEKKANAIKIILSRIKQGESLRDILGLDRDKTILPSRIAFYEWLQAEAELVNQYAYACELRAEVLFDQIIQIADEASNDIAQVDMGDGVVVEKVNHENIQRSRLKIDARKWVLGKMNPKKYGDTIDVTSKGEKINSVGVPIYTE